MYLALFLYTSWSTYHETLANWKWQTHDIIKQLVKW